MSLSGPKGEPGPYGAATELELVGYVISKLEEAKGCSERIEAEDGCNHKKEVDGWVLTQALDALRNYETLLRQPLYELIPPRFLPHRPPEKGDGGPRIMAYHQ